MVSWKIREGGGGAAGGAAPPPPPPSPPPHTPMIIPDVRDNFAGPIFYKFYKCFWPFDINKRLGILREFQWDHGAR